MSVTTEDKRRSIAGVWPVAMPPVPDGNIGEGDRRHLSGLYRFEDIDRIGRIVLLGIRPKYRVDIEGDMLLTVDNDVLVEVTITEEGTGDEVTDAALTLDIYDRLGVAVEEGIEVGYSGSGGVYRGTIPASAGITAGQPYRLVLDASNYGIHVERWERSAVRAD